MAHQLPFTSHRLFKVILMQTSPECMQDFKRYLGTCIYLQIVCSYQRDVLGMSADISRLPYYAYSNRDEWVDPSAYIDYVINHIVKQ